MNLMITGRPGIGKTTLIRKILHELKGMKVAGFYTEEIKEKNSRKGFRLVSIPSGREGVLSHVDIKSGYKVGRYGVDVEGFEKFIDDLDLQTAELAVIDEIGKMECHSKRFRHLITTLLDSDTRVLATIALKGTPFIEEIKHGPVTRLVEITEQNREPLVREIVALLEDGSLS